MWSVAYGVVVFAAVYALLKVSEQLSSPDADATTKAILNMFRIVAMAAALIISSVAIGSMTNVIDAEVASDTTLNDVAQIDTAQNSINTLFNGTIWGFVIFSATLFLFVLVTIIQSLRKVKRGLR